MSCDSSENELDVDEEYRIPINNSVPSGEEADLLAASKHEGPAQTIFGACLATASTNHSDLKDYFDSFMTGRLISIVELCDYKDSDGNWMPASLELFGIIAKRAYRNCRALCCKWHMLPIVSEICRRYDFQGKESGIFSWIGSQKNVVDRNIDGFVNHVKRLENLLSQQSEKLRGRQQKRARLAAPSLSRNQKDYADAISEAWKCLRAWFLPHNDQSQVYFSHPFEKHEVATKCIPVLENLSFPTIDEKSMFHKSRIFPLVTGTLPATVEQQFADRYILYSGFLCEAKTRRCLIPRGRHVQSSRIPFYLAKEDFRTMVFDHTYLTDRILDVQFSLRPERDSDCDEENSIQCFVQSEVESSIMANQENFGLRMEKKRCFKQLPVNLVQACVSLIEHVAWLEESCKKLSADIFYEKRGPVIIVNPLFFLTPSRLRVDLKEDQFAVMPVTTLWDESDCHCVPYELIQRGASVHHILCNNLARLLYFLASGKRLPNFGYDDDEDGVTRSRFANLVSCLTVKDDFLSPAFMHMILCLYLGDCDLHSMEFKAYLSRSLSDFGGKSFPGRPCLKNLSDIILRDVLVPRELSVVDEPTVVMEAPKEGLDYFFEYLQKRRQMQNAFRDRFEVGVLQWSIRSMLGMGTDGTAPLQTAGNGPHRELLGLILMDLCKHNCFELEVNERRREIQKRESILGVCRVCSSDIAQSAIGKIFGAEFPCVVMACDQRDDFCRLTSSVVQDCLAMRVCLPVSIGLSALISSLGYFGKNANLLEKFTYAEHGSFAHRFVARDFECRHESVALSSCLLNTIASWERFGHLREALDKTPEAAYLAVYKFVNSAPYSDIVSSSGELSETVVREMVVSLLTIDIFEAEMEGDLADMRARGIHFESVGELFSFAQSIDLSDEKFVRFVYNTRKMLTTWIFIDWIRTTTVENLLEFVDIVGLNKCMLSRCQQSFYRTTEGPVIPRLVLARAGEVVREMDGPLKIDFFKTRYCPSDAQSRFWMVQDRIRVAIDPCSRKLPVVMTCARFIQFGRIGSKEEMEQQMQHLLSTKNVYTDR